LPRPSALLRLIDFAVPCLLVLGGVQPPWYSAWALMPGAFLLAGAAAMCIIGALVEFSAVMPALWILLLAGMVAWIAGLLVVRKASR